VRWALKHDILLGSRSIERARGIAGEQEKIARGFYQAEIRGSIVGVVNSEAVEKSDVVVVTLPPEAVVPMMTELRAHLHPKQIILSTVVSMQKKKGLFAYAPLLGSEKEFQTNLQLRYFRILLHLYQLCLPFRLCLLLT
jgi:predicted dinucleotide-binding enzyme